MSGSSELVSGLFPGSGFELEFSWVVKNPWETLEKVVWWACVEIGADSGPFS